jgi:hypothetical protein
MAARKKPIRNVTSAIIAIDTNSLSDRDKWAIEKDLCLIETAIEADRIIVTLDDSLRQVLIKTPRGQEISQSIRWIHPVRDGAQSLEKL